LLLGIPLKAEYIHIAVATEGAVESRVGYYYTLQLLLGAPLKAEYPHITVAVACWGPFES